MDRALDQWLVKEDSLPQPVRTCLPPKSDQNDQKFPTSHILLVHSGVSWPESVEAFKLLTVTAWVISLIHSALPSRCDQTLPATPVCQKHYLSFDVVVTCRRH